MSSLIGNHSRGSAEPMEALRRERAASTLKNEALAEWIHGGPARLEAFRQADLIMVRDQSLTKPRFFDIETEVDNRAAYLDPLFDLTMRQIKRYAQVLPTLSSDLQLALKHRILQYDNSFTMRKYVHEVLFRETIMAQGTPEQWASWRDRIETLQVIGSFAMTELGNSSFLRGLETLAVFDMARDGFVITSPTVTSTKWWIGGTGEISTHTVALCQLVINGQQKGLHWFIVPLRDPNSGELLPGITAGYVGPKVGRPGLDNGWVQFSSVFVPRGNMLSRWATVSLHGEHTPPPSEQLPYATLIGERFAAALEVGEAVGQAVTIAVRYGCARLQGEGDHRKPLMDFQTHQHQLMPALAAVLLIRVTGPMVYAEWNERLTLLAQPDKFLADIQDWHSTSSAMKAWFTWLGTDYLEAIRRTMGGHAYSAYNALGTIITNYWVLTTGGGDNVVLAQQSSRYLLSAFQRAQSNKSLGKSVQYFANLKAISALNGKRITLPEQLRSVEWQMEVLQWLTIKLTEHAASLLAKSLMGGKQNAEAWNENMVAIVECSKPHAYLILLDKYIVALRQLNRDKAAFDVAKQCSDLFVLSRLDSMASALLEFGYFDASQIKMLRAEVLNLCGELRKNCVAIVDNFYYPDYVLKAPLGRYDGNIYEAYLDTVRFNLKKTPYWEAEVKPLVGTAKL